MPILAPVITSSIIAAAPTLNGPRWFQLASCIGQAVATWAVIPINVNISGVVTGTVGAGAVTGKMFFLPTPLPVPAMVAAAGFVGPSAVLLANGVGLGVSGALNASAGYVGVSAGAIGADVSKVVFANPETLITLLSSIFAANGFLGPLAPELATGIGAGIAELVMTGTGTGAAAGVPGPAPAAGTSKSSLF